MIRSITVRGCRAPSSDRRLVHAARARRRRRRRRAVRLDAGPSTGPVRVIDPACGDGRFLLAVDRALRSRGVRAELVGVDVDASAVAAASAALAACEATVVHEDAFGYEPSAPFDLVVGNPPFLSPLAARNAHLATTSAVGSPYADAAIQFLLLGWQRLLRPGGRLGFVLPESVLANRDATSARRAVAADGALCWLWWSPRPAFDAAVRTCAIVAERGAAPRPVRRQHGPEFLVATDAPAVGERWVDAVADLRGVPSLDGIATDGTVGERASAGAGFRDEFYGVAAAVSDDDDGSPLVTSGLIDPGVCHWGSRSVRVAKQRFLTPTGRSRRARASRSEMGGSAARAEGARRLADEGDRGGRRPRRRADRRRPGGRGRAAVRCARRRLAPRRRPHQPGHLRRAGPRRRRNRPVRRRAARVGELDRGLAVARRSARHRRRSAARTATSPAAGSPRSAPTASMPTPRSAWRCSRGGRHVYRRAERARPRPRQRAQRFQGANGDAAPSPPVSTS